MPRPDPFRLFTIIALVVFAFCLSGTAQDSSRDSAQCPKPSSWSYPGSNWPTLYPKCCSQSNPETSSIQQSPINITTSTPDPTLKLQVNYNVAEVPVVDKEYTLEVEYDHAAAHPSAAAKGKADTVNQVTYNNVTYTLQQFHFHQPSEDQINGATALMEVHLVHSDSNGNLLVIGVLVKPGAENEGFKKVLANIGKTVQLDPIQMIPGTRNTSSLKFYTYTGSLTTPPCTPPVTWVVLRDPITFSASQLLTYMTMDGDKYAKTSRGVQPAIPGLKVFRNF